MAGLLGRPQPLPVLVATLQRDLSFSRALGELRLRAWPACSEHPRRVRRPSGLESGAESRSPREGRGSWPSHWSLGERVWETLRTPRRPFSALGVMHPRPARSCGGSRGPHSEWLPGWRKTAHGSQPGPCVHGRVTALGTARGREGRTRGLTVSPDSDGDEPSQVTNEDRGVGPHPHRTGALVRNGVGTHARTGGRPGWGGWRTRRLQPRRGLSRDQPGIPASSTGDSECVWFNPLPRPVAPGGKSTPPPSHQQKRPASNPARAEGARPPEGLAHGPGEARWADKNSRTDAQTDGQTEAGRCPLPPAPHHPGGHYCVPLSAAAL